MRNRLKIWRIIIKRKKFYKSLSQEKINSLIKKFLFSFSQTFLLGNMKVYFYKYIPKAKLIAIKNKNKEMV